MDKTPVQADWETREFVETIFLGIRKIGDFLNQFDVHTRHRLALVDDKLNTLERKLAVVENQIASVN